MALRALQGPTGGGTPVGGTGTTNTIPRWTGPTTLGDSIITQTGTSRITVGSGSYAGASLDGVRLVNGVNSYFAASDGTRTVFMGADGNAVVGTLTAHDLKIRAGNADAMIVQQGTLNVGIGTPAPVGRADVAGTSVNQLAWGLLSVRSNDAQGADKGGSIAFGGIYDASNTTHWAQISGRKENGTSGQYGGYLAFATRTDGAGANTERARIDSSGNFILNSATTNAVIQASGTGQGLKLPATPGNADTQTLDCYQENYASNSWTPVIFGGTTAGTATYSVQEGFYTRWGNLIFCTATVVFSGHTGTGNLSLSGLPFAAKTAGSGTYRSSIIIEEGGGVKAILRLQSGTTATTTGVSIAASGNYVITFVYATN
jgi:hypothetical protein